MNLKFTFLNSIKLPIITLAVGVMTFFTRQPAYAADTTQAAPEDRRIMLNIDRGSTDEKLALGARGEEKKAAPGKTKAKAKVIEVKKDIEVKDIRSEKEVGLVKRSISAKEERFKGGGFYSLKDCIDIAVDNHIPLQVAKKSVKLAEMRLFESRRNMLPSMLIDYEEYSGRINDLAYIGRKQYFEGQQPIFHGGELFYTMKQSETNLEITRNDYNRIKNELVLQVKKAYYSLAKAKGNLIMQKKLSEEASTTLDMVTKESEAGLNSKIEMLNVASQVGQIKYQLASAEGDVSTAQLILKQAMNVDTKEDIDVAEILDFKKVEVDFDKALSMAVVNRPEMRINSLMIDYYTSGKKVARSKLLPKVDFLWQWGLAKEEYASQDEVGGAV